ncbi:MAG TPA: phosphonopyruvate decarboxylase [Jatrophihabitans sp.]|jgi:phosphonopyruvate decarboxylase|uniref:phosphonopyruvate decarboxylase n=1 Tax=Jatrophihabitans sp. TaxID=1932789 RepID=UPI002F0DEF5A
MIKTARLLEALESYDFGFFTGVPCSYLGGPIAALTRAGRYLPAANEGAAVAMAAGACTSGRRPVVFAQNSGFGNLVNPLTSLLLPYRLPVLIVMSLRGWPDPLGDEPQHAVMGATTHALLDTLGIRHWTLTAESIEADLRPVLAGADAELRAGRPAFLLVGKGCFEPATTAGRTVGRVDQLPSNRHRRPSSAETISAGLARFPDSLVVSTTGYISRGLFAVHDSPSAFYMQGSMGHASAFALGVALAIHDERTVLLLDGDGAALMHLGSMASVAVAAPRSLVHLLIDNGTYESTGGQPTSLRSIDFDKVGAALGYAYVARCEDVAALDEALHRAASRPGPALIVVRTTVDAAPLPPRATSSVTAPEIAARFALQACGARA